MSSEQMLPPQMDAQQLRAAVEQGCLGIALSASRGPHKKVA
jgi:hypothetical protein